MAPRELQTQMKRFEQVVLRRDARLAEQVLHPAYALVLVQPVPAVMWRARWLEVLPDYVVEEYEVQEQAIDVDDDVAAVLQRVWMKAAVLGQDRSGLFAITDVWRRTPDGWRVWRRHSTPATAGQMPGA